MNFVYKEWEVFCRKLSAIGIKSIPARDITTESANYLVLKHDVENSVDKALKMATIEAKYSHRGSYYVQAYLLKSKKNIEMLQKMQELGHEIAYHHDVMDSSKGDLDKAIEKFEINRVAFEQQGFCIKTVCQHGNPVVERVGYTSNRDFFRSKKVSEFYCDIKDIMVNLKKDVPTEYLYFSDAGRKFSLIHDPINNDVENSDDKNIVFEDLTAVFEYICGTSSVISVHPHRWEKSAVIYCIRTTAFKCIKVVAKTLIRIPVLKKIMSKYYYLAKNI